MDSSKRNYMLPLILCLVFAWWAVGRVTDAVNPPQPKHPVLSFVAKAAKAALWIMLIADQPPETERSHMVHARVDDQGIRVLDHSKGW